MTRVYSSYLADLLQFVQYTRENLSYLADLLKFLQYTIVHLSTFLSGYKMVLQLFDDRGLGNSFARGSCETLLTLCYMGFAKWKKSQQRSCTSRPALWSGLVSDLSLPERSGTS